MASQKAPEHVAATRRIVETAGPGSLVVDDMTSVDLAKLSWSGDTLHVESVSRALERVPSGDVEYLVVRAPSGEPVAKVGIDFAAYPDAGMLWQMATRADLQGFGLGTRLISFAEGRIRRRGLRWAVLGVEDSNPRARALYERLGYQEFGRRSTSWPVIDPSGQKRIYDTALVELRKNLEVG